MRQKNRHKSEVDKFHKQKHHGDTGYDIRIQKRNIGRAEINGLVPFFMAAMPSAASVPISVEIIADRKVTCKVVTNAVIIFSS